MLTASIQLMH